MTTPPTRIIIAAVVIGLLILVALRDSLVSLLFLIATITIALLPYVLGLGLLALIGFAVMRGYLHKPAQQATQPARLPDGELFGTLHTAFRRNNQRQIERTLGELPNWPIRAELQETAQGLLALKRSIYRAQSEGVPSSIVERYLRNTDEAADTMWRVASKLDAIGKQRVSYDLVAPRLEPRDTAAHSAATVGHRGQRRHALLILSGLQSEQLRAVEDDLNALTAAVQRLAIARIEG